MTAKLNEAEAIEAMARARWEHQRRTRVGRKKWEDITDDPLGICQYIRDEEAAAFAAIRPYLDAQFAAGAEAMRDVILQEINDEEDGCKVYAEAAEADWAIRALPIPSTKEPR